MKADTLIQNVNIATCEPASGLEYGAVYDAAVAITGRSISWVGSSDNVLSIEADNIIDGVGGWLTPGLIDCHTHLVYGGNRASEFAERLQGVSYDEIARRGGGILSTVAATRAASEEQLMSQALPRLQALAREGVCTIEIKSGYGLDLDNELKMLRVARALGKHSGVRVVTTLLAAHALPPEYAGRPDSYIDLVCEKILPAAATAGLVDAVDVFCETIAFTVEQCERVFCRARDLNIPVKGHVEQLSHSGGARLVASYEGLSVDHLEFLQLQDIDALKTAGTTAVILPGAYYTLGETQQPPVPALREATIPLAVGSDLNPGSSPLASLLLNMNLACVLFGLTPEESLYGTTCHAAGALGLGTSTGKVTQGYDADLVLWDIESPAQLSYGYNLVQPATVWRQGQHVV